MIVDREYEPLGFGEIEAYLRLMETTLKPWEIRLIKRMDGEWLSAVSDLRKETA